MAGRPQRPKIRGFSTDAGRGYHRKGMLRLVCLLLSLFFILRWGCPCAVLVISAFALAFFSTVSFLKALYATGSFWDTCMHLSALLFGFPRSRFLLIREGRIVPKHEASSLVRVGGPGYLVTYADSAVVLEKGGRFTRMLGPGYFFLTPFETVRRVVDLRPQARSMQVKAITKEGIPIQVDMELEFQLRQRATSSPKVKRPISIWGRIKAFSRHALNLILRRKEGIVRPSRLPQHPFPVWWSAVYKAVKSEMASKDRVYQWDDLVPIIARSQLRTILRQYKLDRLVEPEMAEEKEILPPDRVPRRVIEEQLKRALQPIARQLGVQILRIALGVVEVDADYPEASSVFKQRLESWQAYWAQRAKALQAEGHAAALRIKSLAQAEAQLEMSRAIIEALRRAAEMNVPLRRLITLRCLETLEKVAISTQSWLFVPSEVLRTLRSLRASIEKEADDDGESEKEMGTHGLV